MLKRFIKDLFSCHHKNALVNTNEGFCPDCGRYVKKVYYVVRCADCGIKRTARKSFGKIEPNEKFCTCCGNSDFVVEKYEKLNFSDINYVIVSKETIEENSPINELEIWIDKEEKQAYYSSNKPNIGELKYLEAS